RLTDVRMLAFSSLTLQYSARQCNHKSSNAIIHLPKPATAFGRKRYRDTFNFLCSDSVMGGGFLSLPTNTVNLTYFVALSDRSGKSFRTYIYVNDERSNVNVLKMCYD